MIVDDVSKLSIPDNYQISHMIYLCFSDVDLCTT